MAFWVQSFGFRQSLTRQHTVLGVELTAGQSTEEVGAVS
jgi:hypothetical protein